MMTIRARANGAYFSGRVGPNSEIMGAPPAASKWPAPESLATAATSRPASATVQVGPPTAGEPASPASRSGTRTAGTAAPHRVEPGALAGPQEDHRQPGRARP
ncbi:MAG: hypothetical protein WDO24_22210 [Pseudomonadota bacterium]